MTWFPLRIFMAEFLIH